MIEIEPIGKKTAEYINSLELEIERLTKKLEYITKFIEAEMERND